MSVRRQASRPSFARYQVSELIAKGGMGAIFRAHDTLADRAVAYKRLIVSREAARARMTALFRREYDTLVALAHPNTVRAYDYGFDDDGPYYTMELLEGDDLAKLAPLPWKQACRVLRDIASALALIHARRLVHRDLSPNNVRVTPEGQAKLFDFGALAAFGPQREIMGTPQFMAPENVRAEPLDQRSDLFSLGALAYWILTRQVCFPAREIEDLERAWERPLGPPSSFVADIPAELDELVLSLLELERDARPSSAAHVIERLTTLAALTPEQNEREIALAYLRSPPLVERDEVLAPLRAALTHALRGEGSLVLLEAAAGLGRSALLDRLAVDAQLAGATTLRGEGTGSGEPFELLRQLARLGMQAHPDQTADDSVLIETAGEERARSAAEAVARRTRVASSLQRKIVELSARGPLVVLVDDAHGVDAESLAVLASMADELARHPLLLVLSLRAQATSVDAGVFAKLEQWGRRTLLAPLSEAAFAELLCTTLGDVPNVRRAAQQLHRETGGNPGVSMDLLRVLMQRGQVAYQRGTFTVPHDLELTSLAQSDESLLARLAGLDERARTLLELLALHEGVLKLEQIARTLGTASRDTLLTLEQLGARKLVFVVDESYFLASDLLRSALLRRLDASVASGHHRALAQVLLASAGDDAITKVMANHHLLRSGGESALAGARAIALLARELANEVGVLGSMMRRFEEALLVLRAHGKSDEECLDLLVPLSQMGFYGDLAMQRRYLDGTLTALSRRCGLPLARRLAPWLGALPAFLIGLMIVVPRSLLRGSHPRRSVKHDIEGLFALVGCATAACVSAFEIAESFRIVRWLALFASFPKNSVMRLSYEFCLVTAELGASRWVLANERYGELLQILSGKLIGVEARVREMMTHGCLHGRAQASTECAEPIALELADELQRQSTFFAPHAESVRVGYYGYRGDIESMEHHRARAEALAFRGGISWSAMSVLAVRSLYASALTGNVVGVMRAVADLARLAHTSEPLAAYYELAQAHLANLRGKYDDALAIYERVLASPVGRQLTSYAMDRALQVDALLGRKEYARAYALCRASFDEALADGCQSERSLTSLQQRLALCESWLGESSKAERRLDELLRKLSGNVLLLGLIQRDRALVALHARDADAFDRHARAADALLRTTKNPWLIAQHEVLLSRAQRAGLSARVLLKRPSIAQDSLDELGSTVLEEQAPAATELDEDAGAPSRVKDVG